MIKRQSKRILATLIVILIVSLLVLPSFTDYGVVLATKESPQTNPEKIASFIGTALGALTGAIMWLMRALIVAVTMGIEALEGAFARTGGISAELKKFLITPYTIFFNKIPLIDINFFDFNVGNDIMKDFRTVIATWYYIIRLISAALLLLMLIYVGIRMALSTTATDKVVYKKMLIDWLASLALIYLLHYFIVFIFMLNSTFVDLIDKISTTNNQNVDDYMRGILNYALQYNNLSSSTGFANDILSFMSTIVFVLLVYQTLKFLFVYVKRMMTVAFLVMISPLISVTYSMDKMGDGKAQAFDTWLKEFLYNVFIQPFHCILYMAFADVAFNLVNASMETTSISLGSSFGNGMLAILAILFINKGEQFIRDVFGFGKAGSLESAATAAVAVAGVARKAPELGKSAQKMIGGQFKNLGKMEKAAKKLGDAAAKTKAGKAVIGATKKAGNAVGGAAKKVGNTALKPVKKAGKFVGGKLKSGADALSQFTSSQVQAMKNEADHKQAMKNLRKKHKGDSRWEGKSDEEILNDTKNNEEYTKELDRIKEAGGASSARRKDHNKRVHDFVERHPNLQAKTWKSKYDKATQKGVGKVLDRAGRGIGVGAATVGKWTLNGAKSAARSAGNWVKEGAVAEWENIKSGRIDRYLAPVAGLMTGLAVLDSSEDVIQSIVATKAGYEGTQGFFKNSKHTLAIQQNKAVKKHEKLSGEDLDNDIQRAMYKQSVLEKGNRGSYDKEAIKKLEDEIKKLILSSYSRFDGDERGAIDYIANIKHYAIDGGMSMEDAMTKEGGELPPVEVQEKLKTLIITLNEADLYGSMQTSKEMGMSDEEITGFTKEMATAAGMGTLSMMQGTILDERVTKNVVNNDDGSSQEYDARIKAAGDSAVQETANAGKQVQKQAEQGAEKAKEKVKKKASEARQRKQGELDPGSQAAIDGIRNSANNTDNSDNTGEN